MNKFKMADVESNSVIVTVLEYNVDLVGDCLKENDFVEECVGVINDNVVIEFIDNSENNNSVANGIQNI